MLHMLSNGKSWDRRDTLSRTQWAVVGRLATRGLVKQSLFRAQITDAGLAVLEAELLRDANAHYSSSQIEEMALAKARGEA
jgi:hypothetical protein